MATETVPRADGAEQSTTQPDSVDRLRDDLCYRLGTMLAAARLLSNHQRVHAAVTAAADFSPGFDKELSAWCTTWRDPDASGDDGDVLTELLRVASQELDSLVERAEKISLAEVAHD